MRLTQHRSEVTLDQGAHRRNWHIVGPTLERISTTIVNGTDSQVIAQNLNRMTGIEPQMTSA
nr:hypothetical protein [Trinickia symbiotica]